MLILSAEEVRQALPMKEAIAAMKLAYAALSSGKVEAPLRLRLPVALHEAVSLCMPAYVATDLEPALAVKVVSVFPHNPGKGLPTIFAAVLVLDPHSGQPLALLEGNVLTAIRTGAASGAATDLLSRGESKVVALFGAGFQARTQLEAVCTVRKIDTVWVVDPDPFRAASLCTELADIGPIPADLRQAETPAQALATADIICTATTSTNPVFSDQDIKPGVHINGVGSYTPEMAEVPAQTIQRAYVVIDSRFAALQEAGDLIQPIQAGLVSSEHCQVELGDIIMGRQPGRTHAGQITFFKSVGVAVQDALAAQLALANAVRLGLGQTVSF